MRNDLLIRSAISGVIALGMLTAGTQAVAASKPAVEKCFGIAKAGKNDCASKSAAHSCAGQSTKDNDKTSFVILPKGVCSKIVGGSTQAG